MIEILELAIDFDQTSKTGKGWFLREDWEIEIDIPNNNNVVLLSLYFCESSLPDLIQACIK